jgi:hypothetical protein
VWGLGLTRNIHKILVSKSEGKRLLGRQWLRWEGMSTIKMYLTETGCQDVGSYRLARNTNQHGLS